MKNTFCILLAFFVALALPLSAQEFVGIEFGVEVTTTAGGSNYLVMGARDGCTSGVDPQYQEFELPPLPPTEVFDVRFNSTPGSSSLGTGTIRDFRALPTSDAPFTETYTIGYQAGLDAAGVVISWEELPSRVISGTIEGQDIAGMTEYTTQFNQGSVEIKLTMSNKPLEFSVTPASISLQSTLTTPSPVVEVELICVNDKDAAWEVIVDVPWLLVTPYSGNGDDTLTVQLNPPFLPDGNYNTEITVRARVQDISVTIPVTLSVVDVEHIPLAASIELGQNYPNPFGLLSESASMTTVIPLTISQEALHSEVVLAVYDMYGRLVLDLSDEVLMEPGPQQLQFNAGDLPAGMYWYKLTHAGQSSTRTMLLLK
jgi:hypothetical protein